MAALWGRSKSVGGRLWGCCLRCPGGGGSHRMGLGRSLATAPAANPFQPAHSPLRLQPAAALTLRFTRLSWSCFCNWHIKKAFLLTTDCRGWYMHGPTTHGTLPPVGVPPELRAPTCSAHSVFIQPQHMASPRVPWVASCAWTHRFTCWAAGQAGPQMEASLCGGPRPVWWTAPISCRLTMDIPHGRTMLGLALNPGSLEIIGS